MWTRVIRGPLFRPHERFLRIAYSPDHMNCMGDRGRSWPILGLLLCLVMSSAGVRAAEQAEAHQAGEVAPSIEADIVNTALEHCRLGEAIQAQALFNAIKAQLDLTDPMREIIRSLEASGCAGVAAPPPVRWSVQLGGGYDNNVNQGILSRSLVMGSGLSSIELELGDAYRPKASAFVVGGLDASFRIGNFAVGQVAVQHRDNHSVPELNMTSVVASAISPFSLFDRPGRIQFDLGETWLGGSNYQKAGSAGVQWLFMGSGQPWLASLATLRTNYASLPNQDNQLTELGVWREKHVAPTLGFFGGLSALYDRAVNRRPGGDRAGWRFQLGGTTVMADWLIQPRLNVLRWESQELFSPGLIDVRRRHQLAILDIQLVRPIAEKQQIILEWRASSAQDSVPLFTYRAQSVGVYWRLQR